jgi:hypothetical protein
MILQNINDKMLEFFKTRLEKMGLLESGLQEYYRMRVQSGKILDINDIYLIKEIQSRYQKTDILHELTCGACQVGHTLALLGYNVTASEIYSRRYNLAFELGVFLNSECKVIYGNSFKLNITAKLYYTVNAAFSNLDIKKSFEFFSIKNEKGSDVIINSKLFGKTEVNIGKKMENDFLFLEGKK